MVNEERLREALADRYRFERQLGEGGMATVFLAQDLKHDRQVAVKVLKPELAAILGAERFLNEIRVTANLQHPHILPLFDSGEADGLLFYVMPFVKGETLRDRLNRERQLPVDEAVQIATEVATALDYAHRNQVIHRDIKPGNILLQDGQALVADFGIALAVKAAGGDRVTETGLSLGTPEYMSPEQASADRELDARSDVYSLGAVLYEMLTGEPPHTGPSVQAILSRVLTGEVEPVTARRPTVPVHLGSAVHVALEKVAADRFQSAKAFAAALAGEAASPVRIPTPGGGREAGGGSSNRSRLGRLVANILLVMVFGGISAWVVTKLLPAPQAPSPITSFTVPIPGGRFLGQQPAMALSPDGEAMVFRGEGGLHVRPLSELDTRLLEGTAGGYNPFFSPDGRFVAFVQGGVFKKVALDGGPVAEIAPIPDGWLQGADWGEDGHIVFSGIGGVRRIPAAGGPLEIITSVDSTSEHMHMWPQLLEGGRTLLFTAMGPSAQWADAKIVIKDLASGDQSVVVEGGTFGRYLPTGHILYATVSGTIMAVPFDLASWSMEGDPVPIESGVHVAAWGGGPQVAVSPAGNAAFIRGSVWEDHRLLMVDRSGGERQLGDPVKTYFSRISPDGSRAAVTLSRPGQTNIHLLDLSSGDLEHLTFGTPFHDTAVWSPDGQSIAFSADWVNGVSQVFLQPVDPAAPATLLFTGDYHIHLMDWSPDGQWIVFFYVVPETGYDLYAVRVDSADHVIPVRATVASESSAKFSTDGDWLAYESDGEVYLTPFPPTEGSGQVAVGRGSSPRWARDSGELFFRRGQTLLVAEVSTAGTLSLGPPRPLFDLPENTVRYDVTADGRQFLVAIRNPDAEVREIEVVVNWLREMEERMGGEG